ncbi:flagellin [Allohahella sp. A8]|uniref:flagellin N-terminal helical domain-containing protein n=1 Tax=Allohahella sp. A8 TaxID=3141461 RepID=UPI003A80A601
MPSIVNTNIASLNAQRNLNQTQRASDTALQRLSSGLRINSAKDDAAGLAISTRFDSQIRGTNVAIRNAGDGISLAQTAEGAMDSINTSLQRIRELSLQSANDTNSAVDRKALQEEVSQLVSEIENVAKTTSFNGKNLLDGSFSSASFQTGANVGDTVKVSIGKLDQDSLGSALTAGISSNVSKTALTGTTGDALVAGDLVINGVSVAASKAGSDTSSVAFGSSSALAKVEAINAVSSQTGVTAVANTNTAAGNGVADAAAVVAAGNIDINGTTFSLSKAATGDATADLAGVAETINTKTGATGVVATVVKTDAGARIDLTAEDGRNITIVGATAGSYGLATGLGTSGGAATTGNTYVGDYTLQSNDGSAMKLTSTTGNIDNAGFEVGTYSGTNGGVVGDNATTVALAAGDVTINGVSVGVSKAASDTSSTTNNAGSAIAKAAAINEISGQTGVTAKANANTVNGVAIGTTPGAFTFSVNGASVSGSFTADQGGNQTALVEAINAKAGQSGVTAAALEGDKITLTAADGRNITIGGTVTGTGLTAATTAASVSLESAGQFDIGTTTGNNARAGLSVGKFGGAESGTKLSDIDVSTVEGANKAIKAVDNAVQTISSKRAELGAIQNRFTATISNLESRSENLSAANSRIKDADFAKETAELSRTQVLQQAGISILAQANARPQQALSLLG